MTVYEALTDEECYLAAILMDQSGLDLNEFAFVDENSDDGCSRAWPFQWSWMRNTDMFQVDQGSRSLGKSRSIALRACIFPFVHPAQEMVVTAPEKTHLQKITDTIETMMLSSRLTREMLKGGGGRQSFKHQPFMASFHNGSRIMGMIPNRDGRNVKGCVSAGTPIVTSTTTKLARDVVAGDVVWTVDGWQEVQVAEHFESQLSFEARGQGSLPITASWEHRFYGARSPAKQKQMLKTLEWNEIEDLVDDHVYWATPTSFDALPVPRLQYTPNSQAFVDQESDDFWWLVGRWLADGFVSIAKTSRVGWSVHPRDQQPVLDRLEALGLRPAITVREHSSADTISIACAAWARWLNEAFGSASHNKSLPGWVLGMSEGHRQELLSGYLSGDGHWHQVNRRWMLSSASEHLIVGLQLLAQSLGMGCSSLGTVEVAKYVTSINGVDLKGRPRDAYRMQISERDRNVMVSMDGYLVGKVKSVERVDGPTQVVNLITESHSYLSGSIMSHNSHPVWLEVDETQDYPAAGIKELVETLRRDIPGACYRAHGVTRGVRDEFYKMTHPSSGFTVHHFTAMSRPSWTDQERQDKIKQYGSKDDPDYRRNVLGLHGDATSVLFPLNALMSCVDTEEASDYNLHGYYREMLTAEKIEDVDGDPLRLINYPAEHRDRSRFPIIWIGMDCGYVNDPAEVLVFGETPAPRGGKSKLELLTRITMKRVPHRAQAKVIIDMIEYYRPKVFSMDATGLGLPLFQDVQAQSLDIAKAIRGYNFSSKILVDFDETVEVDEFTGDAVKDAGIERNVKEYAQDCLRGLVDDRRIWFPWDEELIAQFQGGTSTSVSGRDQYGRRRIFSGGEDHILDAARMAAIGQAVYHIEEMVKKKEEEPVYDMFLLP